LAEAAAGQTAATSPNKRRRRDETSRRARHNNTAHRTSILRDACTNFSIHHCAPGSSTPCCDPFPPDVFSLPQRPPPSLLPWSSAAPPSHLSSDLTTTPPPPRHRRHRHPATPSPPIICAPRKPRDSSVANSAARRHRSCLAKRDKRPRGYRPSQSPQPAVTLVHTSASRTSPLLSGDTPPGRTQTTDPPPRLRLSGCDRSRHPHHARDCAIGNHNGASINMAREEIETGAQVAAHAEEGVATPTLISPPESKTPPTETHKRNQSAFGTSAHDRNAEGVDHSHLTKALEQLEQAGRVRERTPTASPSRKRPRIYGDRSVHDVAHESANMRLTHLQVHSEPLRPRPSSQLQPAAR
jgi:hypothetical protein